MKDRDRISYTVPQAAESLGCSQDVIRRAIRAGRLTPKKIRGTTLRVIDAQDLRDLLVDDEEAS